jgi:hypothetical protein
MLKKILMVLYKNSHIIRNKRIRHKDLFNNYINQKGGSINNLHKLSVKYNNHKYIFEKSQIDNDNYVLYALDDLECVSIILNIPDKIAEIHGISNYQTCINTTFSNQHVGSTLLQITIKMLKKYKDILNINKIILVDNSIKKCNNNINIILQHMMILLCGHTWYGRYGFRPIDITTYELDRFSNDKYNNNVNIMKTITISQANLNKYIKLTNKKSLINDVENLVKFNPDYLLTDFIKSFLLEYDLTCKYFNLFYRELFDCIGLTDFRGIIFGLYI